jgi:hypothetical protein
MKNTRKIPKIPGEFPEIDCDTNNQIKYLELIVGDSPEGPLKQPGKPCLKPAKNQSETPPT